MATRSAGPLVCGKCGASFAAVAAHDERFDARDRVWVLWLTCPTCATEYVYIDRARPAPASARSSLPLFDDRPDETGPVVDDPPRPYSRAAIRDRLGVTGDRDD